MICSVFILVTLSCATPKAPFNINSLYSFGYDYKDASHRYSLRGAVVPSSRQVKNKNGVILNVKYTTRSYLKTCSLFKTKELQESCLSQFTILD